MPVVGMVLNALVLQEIYKASKNPAEWMLQTPSRSLRLYLLVTTALTLCTLFPFGAEHYVTAFLLTGVLMTGSQHPVAGLCPANHQKTGGTGLQKSNSRS